MIQPTITSQIDEAANTGLSREEGNILYGGFPKIGGYHFRGPHNKDYNILGSIVGGPLI